MTVREFLRKYPVSQSKWVRPHVICADGYTMSIQASDYHYCIPRKDNADDYEAVEVMVISSRDPKSLRPYSVGGVYAFVPIEMLERIVKRHGYIGAVKEK